jgi:hypothetical protein
MDEFDEVGDSSYLPTPIQEGTLVSPIQEGTLVSREYDFPTVPSHRVLTRAQKESRILEQIPLLKKMFPELKFLFVFKDVKSNIKNVPMEDIDKFIDALTLFENKESKESNQTLLRRMHSALSKTLKGGKSKTKTKTKTKTKRRKTQTKRKL